jgi:tRNA dimethylallyltransferase
MPTPHTIPAPIPFPVIVGPTAGGKSELALQLAHLLQKRNIANAEIVSCDSIQVYRGLDIGSAKPTRELQRDIPHHLIDIVEPTEHFTASDWYDRALPLVDAIRDRGAIPILVGGTHLYIKIFMEGLFPGPAADPTIRQALEEMDPTERRAELERIDPAAADRIHFNDTRRTIRAIEVHRLTGTPISDLQQQWDQNRVRPDCRLVGLDWPADATRRRINARVLAMIDMGLVEEARQLFENNRLGPTAGTALGYKQLVDHFQGRLSLPDAIEQIKIRTRNFAKAQRTWLRRLRPTPGSIWLHAATQSKSMPESVLDQLVEASRTD